MSGEEKKTEVKEDLSRMKGAYGEKMIKKLKGMKVAVFGLRGAGIEIAKNLLLAGPHTVVVHDDEKVKIEDLGANFYLGEADVGKARAAASKAELSDINPNTYFRVSTGPVTTSMLDEFSTVVFTDLQAQWPLSKLVEFDAYCSAKNIKFIWTGIFGMATAIFSNFGKNHEIFDQDGAPEISLVVDKIERVAAPYANLDEFLNKMLPKYMNVKKMKYSEKREWGVKLLEEKLGKSFDAKRRKTISNNEILEFAEADPRTSNPDKFVGKVTVEGVRHQLYTGNYVKLEEVEMKNEPPADAKDTFNVDEPVTDVNAILQIKAHRTNPRVFFVGDIGPCGAYIRGGIGNQKKVSIYKDYQSLGEQLYAPNIEMGVQNFMKFGVAPKLHLGVVTTMRFFEENKRYPGSGDAKAFIALAKSIKEEKQMFTEVDEKLLTKMSMFSRCETNAIAAINGGFVAQEAMKQTGKYTPINQWIFFDAFEIVTAEDRKVASDRYGYYRALFGDEFVAKAHAANFFLVGCGALGCEFLKNIAMMGLGSKGSINITDDDVIELSNLSRQFLFRRKHVSKLKSESAAGVACEMNPEIKSAMNVYKIRVEPKTESTFNCKFWNKLDFVVNALDNIHARNYMDGKCILHAKALFESGTLGTQANSSVHVPHKTPSYKEGSPPGEGGGIAMCTLTNFPYEPLHCIEWSRTMFGQMFEDGPAAYEDLRSAGIDKFLEKVDSNESEGLDKLKNALKWAKLAQGATAETCVKLAFDMFIFEYRDRVKDLINAFPADKKAKNGLPFWRGRKRFPVAQEWDSKNDKFVDFIWHTAFIFADVLRVPKEQVTRDACAKIAASIDVPTWTAKSIEVEDDEEGEEKKKKAASMGADEYEQLANLKTELKKMDTSKLPQISPGDFEKDDDSNHHIDWITSAANLRADTRKIKNSERHHCRMTAGRIIAAIATTTAAITGFVFLELYKKIAGEKDINKFNWTTINLATNQIISEMPADPKKNYTKTLSREIEEDCKIVTKKITTIAVPEDFTCYDFIDIKGDLTFKELFDSFPKVFQGGLSLNMVATTGKDQKILYRKINLDTYREKKKKALERAAKAKNQGHKRLFARQAESAQKFIDADANALSKKISAAYKEVAGATSDPDQPFLLLTVSVEVDPNLPGWLRRRLPKRDKNNDFEFATPLLRLFWK